MGMRVLLGLWLVLSGIPVFADDKPDNVYLDSGVLRWPSGEEIALFGVNYSAPFAFTYRAIERLSGDHEAAIAMDVNHLKRLGVDAYRVHLWDREISDKKGNLLENEHLRLFDFLMAELKKNDIKIIITAIGWWGSGFPAPDPEETGFSTQYTKPEMNQNRTAIAAQKRYIAQLLNHKNSYTGITYKADPDVIAIELFNEPKHHGTPTESAAYIEELVKAARATGLKKPIFYNISEQGDQQDFAAAVCDTSIDGIGYQWYPAGIVQFATLEGNMLPTVQRYNDVFANTGACNRKAKMVYEFDAADIPGSVMYPAMARAFREAGFQWATMFSYDPAVTAHTNAEYNTHYLNLLYTPEKAVSFLIAGEIFRHMPRYQTTAPYPRNNVFLDVALDYHQDLSLLNNQDKFYYSNNTKAQPKNFQSLRHIAGVGSSPIVEYDGSGAYFLDRIDNDTWQLDVYPDLQKLEDPHVKPSLKREVGRLYSNERLFKVRLPGLGGDFYIQKVNEQTDLSKAKAGSFKANPGIYLLSRKKADLTALYGKALPQYLLPKIESTPVSVWHSPRRSTNVNDDLSIKAQVGSMGTPEAVELLARYKGSYRFMSVPMQGGPGGWYQADLSDIQGVERPGPVEYAIVVKHAGVTTTFPGGAQGSPYEWDFINASEYWTTTLRPAGTAVSLFDAEADSKSLGFSRIGLSRQAYVPGKDGLGMALRMEVPEPQKEGQTPLARLALAKEASLTHRALQQYDTVTLQIRSLDREETVTFGVLDEHGLAYSTDLKINEQWKNLSVSLKSLKSSATILPRAYPTFMPGTLDIREQKTWPENADLSRIQGVQFSLTQAAHSNDERSGQRGIEVIDVKLVRGK